MPRDYGYPMTGLSKCLDMVTAIWVKEKRTPVSREDLARAIGYNSLSGSARAQLAALGQFGFLESTDQGTRLSEIAVELMVHPQDSEEYLSALGRAALKPELFREIQTDRPHASDDALRAYLITKREFTHEQARVFVKAFRDTMRFAKPDIEAYNDHDKPQDDPGEEMEPPAKIIDRKPPEEKRSPAAHSFTWPLSPTTVAEVRISGPDKLKPAHLELLRQYLELAKSALAIESENVQGQ